jgi:hypothetical protein
LTTILGGALIAVLAFGGGVLTGRATVSSNGGGIDGRNQTGFGSDRGGPGGGWQSGESGDLPSGGPDGFGGQGGPDGGEDGTSPDFGLGMTSGTITKIEGDTITIETEDGKSYQIKAGSDTAVTMSGDVSDLAEGDSITTFGTPDEDGVISEPDSIIEGGSTGFRLGGFGEGGPGGNDGGSGADGGPGAEGSGFSGHAGNPGLNDGAGGSTGVAT